MNRELKISMVEIVRHVGMGKTGVATAIKGIEADNKFYFE